MSPSPQLLIEKYGLSEEQLAPKLARLAKQVRPGRAACLALLAVPVCLALSPRIGSWGWAAQGGGQAACPAACRAGRLCGLQVSQASVSSPSPSHSRVASHSASKCLPTPLQGFAIKKSVSGTADGSEREGSVKEKGGAATSSGTASVQAGTKEAGTTTAPGLSSGGLMAMSHGGTAAAAMAAAQFEADQQAQTAALMQQLAVQQQLQEAQLAAAAMQAQAQAAAKAQAQAAAQGLLGGGHMLMSGSRAPQAAPAPVGAAGMNLLLDDEFLDEVRCACCVHCVLCMLRAACGAACTGPGVLHAVQRAVVQGVHTPAANV